MESINQVIADEKRIEESASKLLRVALGTRIRPRVARGLIEKLQTIKEVLEIATDTRLGDE